MFGPDHASKVSCTGICTWDWPPLVLASGAQVRAGDGVDAGALGSMPNPSGGRIVTYRGWPLYTFASDNGSGRARGQGKQAYGGRWSLVSPSPGQ